MIGDTWYLFWAADGFLNGVKSASWSGEEATTGHAAIVGDEGSLRLVLPSHPSPVLQNIGRVFVRQIESRCDVKVVEKGPAELAVELAIEPGIGEEGFKIADGPNGTIRIIGNDQRGVLYGVGQFLHTSSYGPDGFAPSKWRGVSVPKMLVRGMYLATHMQNYYEVVPVQEMTRYMEDLSLWGVNAFLVWFDLEPYDGIDDPKAKNHIERLRVLLKMAKDLGLDASLGCIANGGYRNSPRELRAEESTVNRPHYHSKNGPRIYITGPELCPSKPGVPEMEMSYCQEKFDAFKSVGLDYWFIAPYDNGGCTCAKCAPWGANGFLRMAEPMARAYKKAFPKGKVILSTWYFDRWGIGEWDGIAAKFNAKKPDWVDYIMCDNFEEYPRYPLEHGVPGGLPLLNFPDISMYGQEPWGGYGANPHPGRLQQRWDQTKQKLSGGFPYSEGIYEDINKVICARLWWEPERPAIETVKDYAAYEFSPDVTDDVARVVSIFEKNHQRSKVGGSAVEAARLVEQIDAKLAPRVRSSWRWRLFCIRAAIDQEIHRNSLGLGRDKVFRQACDELTKISHAENAWAGLLRPVPMAAVNVEGPGLPSSYGNAVAASKPSAWWRMDRFHERNIEDATEHRNGAVCENGVMLLAPSNAATNADTKSKNRAASFNGGRIRASIAKLPDTYSVEFWFCNALPNTARPVTAYLFSRGEEGPKPGDNLGIAGTSAVDIIQPGCLFFYNGDAAKQVLGKTELAPNTWHHVALVRDGKRIAVYLDGNSIPEISGQMAKGYPDGVTQLFIGGRNDNFGNLQGRIAEACVYDRPLTQEEVVGHYKAAGPHKSIPE